MYLGSTVPPIGLSGDGTFLCQNLQSSGSDDEASFIVLALLFLPALMRVLRFRSPVSGAERAVVISIVALAYFLALYLADCSNWSVTAQVTGNLHLIALMTLMPLAVLLYLLPDRREPN